MRALWLAMCLVSSLTFASFAVADELGDKLAEVEKQIAAQPDDPLPHYQRAQLLAQQKKFDDAYLEAQVAMEKFKLAKKELAWLRLETFAVDGYGVWVNFNMGRDERNPPRNGIIRPLSFRIFDKDGKRIVDTFDFEIGYVDGKPLTGAFGQTTATGHANLGPVKPTTPYSKLRPQAIELVKGLTKGREEK